MKYSLLFWMIFLSAIAKAQPGLSPYYSIIDVCPGQCSSLPYGFTVINDNLYFLADSGSKSWQPFVTDGTLPGTKYLGDVTTAEANFSSFGSKIIFNGYSTTYGYEPWITDGTANGTRMIKDIVPGGGSSLMMAKYYMCNGKAYFVADDGVHGMELWVTDGTANGTQMLLDINPTGQSIGWNAKMVAFKGKLYFPATNGLWETDGTSSGTIKVASFASNAYVKDMYTDDNRIYFTVAHDANDIDLYAFDNITPPTLLSDYPTGTFAPVDITLCNGKVFFATENGLWVSDGTYVGTMMLRQMNPNRNSAYTYPKSELAINGNMLYFRSPLPNGNGDGLWQTDGTTANTIPVDSNLNQIGDMTSFNNRLYFNNGDSLFSVSNALDLKNETPTACDAVLKISSIAVLNNELYFGAYEWNTGWEIWRMALFPTTAGSVAKTDIHCTIYPNPASDLIHISVDNYKDVNYSIANSTGQILNKGKLTARAIDISNLPANIYYLKLQMPGSNSILKFSKQ